MGHRPVVLAGSAAVLVGTYFLFKAVPTGFLPSDDTSFLRATTEGAQGASYEDMVRHQQEAAEIVNADPNVSAFVSAVGGGRGQSNQGRFIIRLKERGERALDADGVARELTRKLNRVPGLQTFVQNPPTITIGGRQSKALYQFTMQGTDLDALYRGANALETRLANSPQLADVNSDLQLSTPTAQLSIDRERAGLARRLGHGHRADALRRVRLAPGVDHLHQHQPVLGDPRGRPGRAARPRRPRAPLREEQHGRARARSRR
jgi:HAE1 family hydrophobic/amphiphilic exporter-1